MVTLSPAPKLQFLDGNGDPVVGGKLTTYIAGTVTKLTTYTDSTRDTANTNPIILGSLGEADIWLDPLPYKYVLTTSTDGAVWTVDNVNANQVVNTSAYEKGSDAAAASHSSIITGHLIRTNYLDGNRTPESGSVLSYTGTTTLAKAGSWPHLTGKFYDLDGKEFVIAEAFVTPKQMGALGNGSTDDSIPIQRAINSGQNVRVPASSGNYRMTGGGVTFGGSNGSFDASGAGFEGAGEGSGTGFTFASANHLTPIHLGRVSDFSDGVLLEGASLLTLELDTIARCTRALVLETVSATHATCLDNNVKVQAINDSDNAIVMSADANGNVMQGNQIYCNFSSVNIATVRFSGSGLTPNWDSNTFTFSAIDPSVALTTARGLVNDSDSDLSRITWNVLDWFGGFHASAKYIESAATLNNVRWFLHFAENMASYGQFLFTGINNKIDFGLNQGGPSGSGLIAAQATSNNRASFNSGTPVTSNTMKCSFAVSGLASQASVTWFVYSPLSDGSSQILDFTPLDLQGLTLTKLKSVTGVANEIEVGFFNGTSGSVTASVELLIRIGKY
ncbi:hypothetical protein LCGC14_0470800 [marine sediment metagenome]|uniref:Pectate lyase superfamily protein domain-containing protein n=1 Tax=marine sediment metagenome TaxID=412755 RepID=A0A0F9UZ64_9ZZZZ